MPDPFVERGLRRGLSEDDAATLARGYLGLRHISAKRDIVEQNVPSDQLHILLEGWACKYKLMADGSRQMVVVHLPGEICDLDRIHDRSIGFGVMALTECRVTSLDLSAVLSLIDQRSSVRDFLWASTVGENAAMIESIANNGRRSPRTGVAYLLCDLLLRLEVGGQVDHHDFQLELRQSDIADLLGLSIVHINRTIQGLRAEGLIAGSGRRLDILDREKLEAIAEFDRHASLLRNGGHRVAVQAS